VEEMAAARLPTALGRQACGQDPGGKAGFLLPRGAHRALASAAREPLRESLAAVLRLYADVDDALGELARLPEAPASRVRKSLRLSSRLRGGGPGARRASPPAPPPAPSPAPPPLWQEAVDVETGRAYYYSESLGLTQWERPAGQPVAPMGAEWRAWYARRWGLDPLAAPGVRRETAGTVPGGPSTAGTVPGGPSRREAGGAAPEGQARPSHVRFPSSGGSSDAGGGGPPRSAAAAAVIETVAALQDRWCLPAEDWEGEAAGGPGPLGAAQDRAQRLALAAAASPSPAAVGALVGAALALADRLPGAVRQVTPLVAWLSAAAGAPEPPPPPAAALSFWAHAPAMAPDRSALPESLLKYHFQRYRYFSRFDDGCAVDHEGWFSVTPEAVALRQAERCATPGAALDAFCGVGGNALHLASTCGAVTAVDLSPGRLALARHNARVYGVEGRVRFVGGDFLRLARDPGVAADVVFLSPPWGGPEYLGRDRFPTEPDVGGLGVGLAELLGLAMDVVRRAGTPPGDPWGVAVFLPRNVCLRQLHESVALAVEAGAVPPGAAQPEVEEAWVNGKLVAVTAYVGSLAATYRQGGAPAAGALGALAAVPVSRQ